MRKIVGLFMALMLIMLSAAGCDNTNGNGVDAPSDSDVKVEFEVISDMQSLPQYVVQTIEMVKKNRGYAVYNYDGYSYVAVIMGEQSSAGYSIDIESVQKVQDVIEIKTVENSPAEDEVLAQVLTYPVTVVKVVSDIQKFSVESSDGRAYDEIVLENFIKVAQGTYIGQIDGNSIEIKIGEEFNAFRLNEEMKENIDSFEESSNVAIKYYENEHGQLILIELEKAGQ